jgi:PleD family two-component response regulator
MNCDYPFAVTLACGAVEYGQEYDLSFSQLLKQADSEMYNDKRQE